MKYKQQYNITLSKTTYITLIYCERVITAFGRRINENKSPSGRQAIPTPPNIWIEYGEHNG